MGLNALNQAQGSNYNYPAYKIDLTKEKLDRCCDIAIRLLNESGMVIRNEKFLNSIKGKEGVRISGERVYLDKKLLRERLENFISKKRELSHKKTLKDRAKEECLQRIKNAPQFELPPEKQKALDEIYKKAETELLGGD